MPGDGLVSPAAFIARTATLLGDVTVEDKAGIWFGAVVRADKDRIHIGHGSNIQDNCVVHTSAGHPVRLGAYVSVGHGAILHGCMIRDRVLIGMGAIVLNGADIGEDSIVGAGAVVTEGSKIPPSSVVIGVPARVIKQTTDEQRRNILMNAESYIELAGRYADG